MYLVFVQQLKSHRNIFRMDSVQVEKIVVGN